MDYHTVERRLEQQDYYQLMSEITQYQYSETEFDPYFPSSMTEQLNGWCPDELQTSLTDIHHAFSNQNAYNTSYASADSQQCLSTPTFDFTTPQFGYNSLNGDTLYSSLQLSSEFPSEAPQSPAESSSSESNSETESTGTPAKLSRSRSKRQSRTKTSSCARRTNKRKKGKLWEFLLDLLMSEETNPSIIKWEDQSKGIFRILDCSHVAYLWGKRKSNPSMTYEKLSRALRYYYDLKILMKIEGHKLLYRFGDLSLA